MAISLNKNKGFSLLEVLVVLGIAGLLFAVILPRAWRARIDTNHSLVRQAAANLGNWGLEWAERNLAAQDESDTCTMDDYLDSLIGYIGGLDATSNQNNWFGTVDPMTAGCRSSAVAFTVAEIMPQENQPRNPFNGLNYLHQAHNGSAVQPGLLYFAMVADSDGFNNYHFIFTGDDTTSTTDWFAGMGDGLPPSFAELKNGVFVSRLKP
jgi:prepilin-type N-terminal cleavage/methylation domain-containing protein